MSDALFSRTSPIWAACVGASCRFGELGEYMMVVPKDNETIEKAIGMVPIRISIVVTLRELRPLAGRTMQFVSVWHVIWLVRWKAIHKCSSCCQTSNNVAAARLRDWVFCDCLQDPYGQVNPVYVPPVVDKMSVQVCAWCAMLQLKERRA